MTRIYFFVFFTFFTSTSFASSWVKIVRPAIVWEDMVVNEAGERKFYCGEFDTTYTGRYHWRYNRSSILPEQTQVHRNQFVFLAGSHAIRNQLSGEYECCVRETLGNACYSRQIYVTNLSTTHNIDLISSEVLNASIGDTYYIRLIDVRRIEAVRCTLNGEHVDNFKYPFVDKSSKKAVPYHLKIENINQSGEVICDIRLQKKDKIQKSFVVQFDTLSGSNVSSTCFPICFLLLLIRMLFLQ